MTQTILIAADDPNILYLLQRYAEESGFDTIKTGQVREIPDLAQQIQPAIILMELDRGGIVSRSILTQLQVKPTTSHIPVVVYSPTEEESRDPLDGFVACLSESVMYDDFLAALAQAGISLEG